MSKFLDVVSEYAFSGVPSNAVYDLIKKAWKSFTHKSWEELYLEAFQTALKELRPSFVKYIGEGGVIEIEQSELQQILCQELDTDAAIFSELNSDEFASNLAKEMVDRSALILGGHQLSEQDYIHLINNLLHQVRVHFKQAALSNPVVFNRILLEESLKDQKLAEETSLYLEMKFNLVLSKLSAIEEKVEQLSENALIASKQPMRAFSDRLSNGTKIEQVIKGAHQSIIIGTIGSDAEVHINSRNKFSNPGYIFQANTLPSDYVSRSKVISEIKSKLMQETPKGVLGVSTLHGAGGIGKSLLAAELVHEEDIQDFFSDGILWVTLGQEPKLLSLLSQWIQALGDYNSKPTSQEAASNHLKLLLHDKQMLLVVDDVWNAEDAELFRVGSASCRMLITTREAIIPDSDLHEMDVMCPEQAMTLLQKASRLEFVGTDYTQGLELIKALGCLPLALKLAAAQLEYGTGLQELLDDLKAEIARLENFDTPGTEFEGSQLSQQRNLSLIASYNLSLRRLPTKQLSHFTWLGVLPEDVSFNERMAATLWNLSEQEARKALRDLKRRALLLTEENQPNHRLSYRLHDIVRYLTKRLIQSPINPDEPHELRGLGLSLMEAQQILLATYKSKSSNGKWYTLPDDGYIHSQLVWHLEQAKQIDEIHQLFCEMSETGHNGWYEVCDRMGQTANFINDVARAWKLAEDIYEQNPTQSITLQYRYALIITSLNSLAQNIPIELIVALVEKGIWTSQRGLIYVQQLRNSQLLAIAIKKLTPYLSETLLSYVLETARSIPDKSSCAQALIGLATRIPELIPEAFAKTREIQNEFHRTQALNELIPILPKSLHTQVLEVAREMQQETTNRASVLNTLVQYSPELLTEAIEVARTVQKEYRLASQQSVRKNEYSAFKVLKDLLPYKSTLLPEALAAARRFQDQYFRAFALSDLAQYSKDIQVEALETTRLIQQGHLRVRILIKLAGPGHDSELLSEALEITQRIPDKLLRHSTLCELAPHMPELLTDAFEALWEIEDEASHKSSLGKIACHLSERLLHLALERSQIIGDDYFKAIALIGASSYSSTYLIKALEATREIQNEIYRTAALSEFALNMPTLLAETLDTIQNTYSKLSESSVDRYMSELQLVHSLSRIISNLPKELLQKALEVTRMIQDDALRSGVLVEFLPHFPEILPEALETALKTQPTYKRVQCLVKLFPYAPGLINLALQLAQSIQDDFFRITTLKNLIPYFPELLPALLE
ncbi:MAG: hypothetical protein F6K11_26300, partial [Leptolyngbya sp. SIO3F4]|nr:hypothetical protein [Leptolyngbya sp. SIO3F4]